MTDYTEVCTICGKRIRVTPRRDGTWAYEMHFDPSGHPCGGSIRIGLLTDDDEEKS